MARTPTAKWPADSLMMSLRHAGYGDLSGRQFIGVRVVLEGLVASLPFGSAQGLATVAQIADRTGHYSTRWVRRCLGILEEAGIITWQRGGIAYGRPRPSAFRVNKKLLVDMIHGARPVLAVMRARRKALTDARVAGLRFVKSSSGRNRRSVHVELSSTLPPSQGGDPPGEGAGNTAEPPETPLSVEQEQWLDDWFAQRAARRARLAPSRGR